MGLWILLVVAVVALRLLVLFLEGRKEGEHRYRSQVTLLTPAEQRFHSALRSHLPTSLAICPKVRLWDVITCPRGERSQAAINKISQKHVDFVLIHIRSSRIVAVVELDDPSHLLPDRIRRDAFVAKALQSAGIPLVRVKAAASYDIPAYFGAIFNEAERSEPRAA